MKEKKLQCPYCNSNNIREGSDYADNKNESQKASKEIEIPFKHTCLSCYKEFTDK